MAYLIDIIPIHAKIGRRRLLAGHRDDGSLPRAISALLTNLTPRGFLLQRADCVTVGSQFWMKLRGSPPVRARVIWKVDDETGCEFAFPLTARSIREMVIAARSDPLQLVT